MASKIVLLLCSMLGLMGDQQVERDGFIVRARLTISCLPSAESLVIGSSAVLGHPMSEYFDIWHRRSDGSRAVIKDLSDLEGAVVIDTPAKALEYVRITTSPATAYLFWRRAGALVEVTKASQIGSAAWLNAISRMNPSAEGLDGVISDSAYADYALREPTVTSKGGVFVILRVAAKGEDPLKLSLGLLEQHVTRSGRLLREQFQLLKNQPPVRWRLSEVR
jgi:hypothetical protein